MTTFRLAGIFYGILRASALGATLLFSQPAHAAESILLDAAQRQKIEQALSSRATAQPLKPRRLLIFTRNQEYQGHAPAIAASCEAFTRMGRKTGSFETTISDDPAVFERASLKQFDAVFLNNTLGATFTEPQYRQNLMEFVTRGGGLMGVHSTVIAFTKSLWPAQEDWREFGYLLGARGYAHHHGYHTSIHTWFAQYGDNHHTKTFGFSIRLIRDDHAK